MSDDDAASVPTAVDERGGRPPWLGPALIAVAALLIGIGGGLAIGSARSGSDGDHPHGNATAIGFSQDMITHHRQAVEMTQIVIERGSDAAVRNLAVTMLSDQNREIGQMTGWLQAWGAPLTNPGAPMSWMGRGGDHCADGHVDEHCPAAKADDHHGGHGDGHSRSGHGADGHSGHGAPAASPTAPAAGGDAPVMEGMATKAEMARLAALSGPAADTYFLQLMLRHHQGGHHMMSMVIDPANGAPEYVRALAEQMDKAQTAEESTMKQMLAQRHAEPLG